MDSREMFLVMGYGETPMPEIELVSTLDEAFNAVARMVYGDPSPSELLEAHADFCDFEERVRDGFEWHAEFEIGGIHAWKVCVPDDLKSVLAAHPADAAGRVLPVANEHDAKPIGDELTRAAISALRSYQYGNASPELAKSIADKLSIARSGGEAC